MEQYLSMISVPAIAVVVYWIVKIVDKAAGGNEKFRRFIPLMSAGLGVICGIICFYALPTIIPADNVVVAIVIGGASGLSATGTDQMIKQMTKDKASLKEAKSENHENDDNLKSDEEKSEPENVVKNQEDTK